MLSDAVIFSNGHSPWALVVNLNQVTGVIPLLVQSKFEPVADEAGNVLRTPSNEIVIALAQLVPCVKPVKGSARNRATKMADDFIDILNWFTMS